MLDEKAFFIIINQVEVLKLPDKLLADITEQNFFSESVKPKAMIRISFMCQHTAPQTRASEY